MTGGHRRLRIRVTAPGKLPALLAALLLAGGVVGVWAQWHRELPAFVAVAMLQGAV